MSDVLNIAVQCNSPEQLIALIAIMIFVFALTVVVLKGIIRFTGMVLSTILHYHNAIWGLIFYLHKVKIIYLELPYQDNNVEAFLDTE